MTDRAVSGWGSWMGLVLQLVTLLPGYANPLKRLDTSEAVNLHKYLILLDSCRIHATRCRDGEAETEHSKLRNVKVLSLPTGQGVIIKP